MSPPIRQTEFDNAARYHSMRERSTPRGDFGNAPIRVEIYPSEETVEIFIEADFDYDTGRTSALCHSQHSPPPV
jgi:hypothetical protein